MKNHAHRTRSLLAAAVLAAVTACDVNLEPLTAVTQALGAEDAAAGDEAAAPPAAGEGGDGDDAAGLDDVEEGRVPHDCDRERRERGIAPPDGFEDVALAACLPPLADGVDPGRAPRHRGHLAPLYDSDESHSLDDGERQQLFDDVTAGCTARNARLLADFDADTDGALSQTEWDAARAARREAREAERAALDSDGDGEISREEHEAARANLIATWDSDASGDLDEGERATMRADLQERVRAGDMLPPLPLLDPRGRGGDGHHAPEGRSRPDDDDDRAPPPPPGGASEGEG